MTLFMKKFIIRGILIGGSFGILSALSGFYDNIPKAFFIGVLCGFLAGLTLGILQKKKKISTLKH